MGLRIEIHDQGIFATASQQPRKIQRGRRFADATFLIEHRNSRHRTSSRNGVSVLLPMGRTMILS
jgi:hypothetical protein